MLPDIETPARSARGASSPTRPLPPGAWDTHAHVFGPFERYPLAADCRYQPPLAPREAHAAMLQAAGFDHAMLVHASANGYDNSAVLDALAADRRHVGVAVVREDTTDAEFARLHDAGIRGLRFTENGEVIGAPKPSGTLGLDALRRMSPRLRELGWHAQVWAKCDFLAQSVAWLETIGVPLVVDHMGAFDVARGVHDPAFQRLLGMARGHGIWVKLVPVRVTKQRWNDCADVRPFHDAWVEAAPGRLLWGSDWPYIAMDKDLPNVGAQIDLFDAWTPDETLRHQVFVQNPRQLYDRLA